MNKVSSSARAKTARSPFFEERAIDFGEDIRKKRGFQSGRRSV